MLVPVITPEGFLTHEGGAESTAERKIAALDSSGALLCLLCTDLLTAELEPAWRWLRDYGRQFFTRLCQTKDALATLPPAMPERVAHMAAAPPFAGAEYLSPEILERWWLDLAQHIARLCAELGVEDWLRQSCPAWHAVGRVTFHLAENKTDTQRPFAFLATFTEKLSATGQPQHLPLARALQLYAGQKDQAALNALLEPVRTAAEKSKLLREWLETKRLFQPMAMSPQEAFRVLRDTAEFQESGIVMKLPDWWRSGKGPRPAVAVTIDAPKQASLHVGALMSFKISASMDGEPLTDAEWEKLLSADTGLVSLRGRWVEVDGAQLKQVMSHWERVQHAAGEGGIGFLEGMRMLAGFDPRLQAVEEESTPMVHEWSDIVAGKNLATLLQQMRDPAASPPPPNLCATLRPYQLKGFSWLQFMTRLGLGACLADDMGLGKTLQVIALLLARQKEAKAPGLLIVPASLVGNWRAEVAKFAPDLRLFIAHPSQTAREELDYAVKRPAEALRGYDAMLTTYQFLQRTESWQQHAWSMVILDEAQAIKNPGSGSAKAVKNLQAPARIALTGTPVENRPGDLWSLFDFLNPGLLGSSAAFADVVKRCAQSSEGFAPLRRLVQPYILRRMKTDRSIISDLPDKIETKAFCGLTKRQATIYAKLVDQLAKMLADKSMEPIKRQGLVLGFLLKFKQICNHPSHWNGDGAWNPEDSGKFARLAEICGELAERRERALIFTQFQETCDPLARFLAKVFGREGLILHGGTAVKKRPQLVESFQQPGGPPFMVISVKAGGTGLTLTAASHVIHFDRWWNPAVENQATDRAFRIGQKKNVMVHKFVCQGTIEERIDALIEKKMSLAHDLITGEGGAEKLLTEMGAEELLDLVRLDVNAAVV
ncbi:DEAD/DEAH box helicase [Prosthecobacter vanneervenii]|uniref:Non-specific serine/threonine protein kinase n=1 Tax=Prosthecobacter vanneervenii TaxID=48466 RepID=A0A7W7YA77_9BACT|nr:DEAD/DEAH box helicase [Prosthecobacter vanneervenii]MBB5032364.1 non-specific serine/threonine protein kinase [Prosthecobacter vanneervenii]